jgi:hypothetical protein
MVVLSDIKLAIENCIVTTLPTYSPIDYQILIEKNKYTKSNNRFAVHALDCIQADVGIACNLTLDQTFEVLLFAGYKTSQVNDSEQMIETLQLQQKVVDIYKYIYSSKVAGVGVVQVSQMTIDAPEYLEEDKVALIRFRFTVKYRTQL